LLSIFGIDFSFVIRKVASTKQAKFGGGQNNLARNLVHCLAQFPSGAKGQCDDTGGWAHCLTVNSPLVLSDQLERLLLPPVADWFGHDAERQLGLRFRVEVGSPIADIPNVNFQPKVVTQSTLAIQHKLQTL
jgi:hypothetical protein